MCKQASTIGTRASSSNVRTRPTHNSNNICLLLKTVLSILFERKCENQLKKVSAADDLVLNDFKREMMFYCQAQATVLESIPKLKALGIPTKRPEDYSAVVW